MPDASHDPPSHDPAPGAPLAGLVLVATPIGNLGDFSPRAVSCLRQATLVLCEDTRVTARLLAAHDIRVRTSTLHDHNEESRIAGVLARLREGASIALVSDAGTPLLSDPGFRLVRAAIAEGLPVTAIPGPNAAVAALILSGLPPHPYLFHGFPPPRDDARRRHFGTMRAAERAGLRATLIWHEAPHRLAAMLADLHAAFGPRPVAVARELTKRFEEMRRGPADTLAAYYADHPPRGEITVVLAPADDAAGRAEAAEDLDERLAHALRTQSPRDAASLVALETGLPRKLIYDRMLILKNQSISE